MRKRARRDLLVVAILLSSLAGRAAPDAAGPRGKAPVPTALGPSPVSLGSGGLEIVPSAPGGSAAISAPISVEPTFSALAYLAHGLPEAALSLQDQAFRGKDEAHVTAVSSRKGEELVLRLRESGRGERAEALLLEGLREAGEGLKVDVTPEADYRLVRKGPKSSIIQVVSVSEGFGIFYERLEKLLGLEIGSISRTPPHVTLFTEKTGDPEGRGIGIYSAADMDAARRIEPSDPALGQLRAFSGLIWPPSRQ